MTASVGVAMIDMDDFKIYNDTYGHNAGDLALITTVEAIRHCIRKNDTLIRYGGDEFLLVLQGISETMFREKLSRSGQKFIMQMFRHIQGFSYQQVSVESCLQEGLSRRR